MNYSLKFGYYAWRGWRGRAPLELYTALLQEFGSADSWNFVKCFQPKFSSPYLVLLFPIAGTLTINVVLPHQLTVLEPVQLIRVLFSVYFQVLLILLQTFLLLLRQKKRRRRKIKIFLFFSKCVGIWENLLGFDNSPVLLLLSMGLQVAQAEALRPRWNFMFLSIVASFWSLCHDSIFPPLFGCC